MAIITPPEANLPPESMQWGRSVDQNIVELNNNAERNFANINNTLRQVSVGLDFATQQLQHTQVSSESKILQTIYPAGDPVTQYLMTDYDASTVFFTAPSWATHARILAFGTFSAYDTATSGFSGNVKTRIDTSYSGATTYGVPNSITVYSGGMPTGAYAEDTSPAPITIPHVYEFEVIPGETYSASQVVTKNISGAQSTFACTIVASVNWYQ